MSHQKTILTMTFRFDARKARANKERAMARVSEGKDAWMAAAKWTVIVVASENREFTTDALWKAGLEEAPGSNRALGPVMKAAAKAGVIADTGRYVPTTKAQSHAQPIRVWRSLIFEGNQHVR
jgi:hypothetical protein